MDTASMGNGEIMQRNINNSYIKTLIKKIPNGDVVTLRLERRDTMQYVEFLYRSVAGSAGYASKLYLYLPTQSGIFFLDNSMAAYNPARVTRRFVRVSGGCERGAAQAAHQSALSGGRDPVTRHWRCLPFPAAAAAPPSPTPPTLPSPRCRDIAAVQQREPRAVQAGGLRHLEEQIHHRLARGAC